MGFVEALFIVFLILKLCGVITWSWWWVTAPLWIAVVIDFVAISLFVGGSAKAARTVSRRR